MSNIQKDAVMNALKTVIAPNVKKDLVSANMVKDITIDGSNVKILIESSTPVAWVKEEITKNATETIKKQIPEASDIKIDFEVNISKHVDPAKDKMLPGVKNTIAVASGKGGVGKSTVAVNLALSLAMDGAKVGLLDADVYGPSIPMMLGVREQPLVKEIDGKQRIIPLENYGIKLMSIGFLVDENTPVIWRGPMATGALKQFMSDVEWGEIDYLFYDLPPGTGDIQLTLAQTIPLTGSVIVTTPQDVSLLDARKGLKMFEKVNVPILGLIENLSYFIAPDTGKKYNLFGSGGGVKLAKELNTEFLGGIPINPIIVEGGDTGKPLVAVYPETEEAKIYREVARKLAAEINERNLKQKSSKIEISL